ncbi:prepilin-type N-terminal cleavage/methylation domain-containing protein, partial [bacterium]|nr:prepilin-type N-terminal cleavage/methylation domain-containing protein [bacterium]
MNLRRNSHPIDMNQARTGFTLVELLISIAVISILAGMAAQVFSVLLQSREIAMRRIEISETANAALEFMAAEIRSAYLTPNSVKPRLTADSPQPRFRFAGISRNVVIDEIEDDEVKARIPGAGEDDDGDGWIDEEFLDGVDEDYNPVDSAPALGGRGRPREEPIPCEEGDSSCIDEDIGAFPSDMLHFVSAVENSGQLVLSEVSYGLDPAGLKLV